MTLACALVWKIITFIRKNHVISKFVLFHCPGCYGFCSISLFLASKVFRSLCGSCFLFISGLMVLIVELLVHSYLFYVSNLGASWLMAAYGGLIPNS